VQDGRWWRRRVCVPDEQWTNRFVGNEPGDRRGCRHQCWLNKLEAEGVRGGGKGKNFFRGRKTGKTGFSLERGNLDEEGGGE